MFLGAAAEGTTPDVVPQLFDQFWILLLYLLGELLSAERNTNTQNISNHNLRVLIYVTHQSIMLRLLLVQQYIIHITFEYQCSTSFLKPLVEHMSNQSKVKE